MNDTLEDRLLTDRLRRMADGAPVPTTPVRDDVRRGRGRLRRRRALLAAGSAAVVVALAGGGFALVGGEPESPAPDPSVASGPVAGESLQGAPDTIDADLARQLYLARIVDELPDQTDEATFTLAELSALTEVLRDRLRGDQVLWFGAGRATSWDAAGGDACPAGWTCDDVTVDGASRAAFATSGTVRQLVAELPSGTLVLTFNTVDERPADVAYGTD